MKKHAVIYARVSTDKQGKSGLGLEAQLETTQAFCAREGLEVIEVVVETASGADDHRPKLQAAIRLAKSNNAFVVVARLCRLSRRVSFVSKLMEQGCPFVSVEFGTEINPLILHIFSAVYENQRQYISMRTKEALKQAKARGVKLGNPRWQGALKTAWEQSVTKADQFALQMEPILNGIMAAGCTTYQSIADALNNRGIPTRSKKPGSIWYPSSVKNVLTRLEALNSSEKS